MSRPVLVLAEHDAVLRQLLHGQLKARYGERYDVIAAASPKDAREKLQKLQGNNRSVALVLADSQEPSTG